MAINQNFVVKNGLDVVDSTLYVNGSTRRVGIGTSLPERSFPLGKYTKFKREESGEKVPFPDVLQYPWLVEVLLKTFMEFSFLHIESVEDKERTNGSCKLINIVSF